ncbi:thioesterase domain-containing protein [Pleionea sp. CnH1-48]|uniref:thioesterase II family protein n=1 Tax=Pleionea sp. CnH1-48 TaxID=2954494 RepID=UPI0020972752|nr:thioesterase domain-containing protein [Pleionea sp. CnH1-48]
MHALPYDEFIEELKKMNGTPAEILTNRELMELFIPVLRSDFKMNETYRYTPSPKLSCPASIFRGTEEIEISEKDCLAWQTLFHQKIDYTDFPGDHFFIHSCRDQVVNKVADIAKNKAYLMQNA